MSFLILFKFIVGSGIALITATVIVLTVMSFWDPVFNRREKIFMAAVCFLILLVTIGLEIPLMKDIFNLISRGVK